MSLDPAGIRKQLQRILADEARLLNELETLLQQEMSALEGTDLERINRVGASRHECIQTLSRLDAERADAARMLSFGQGRAALERLFKWADATGGLKQTWLANLDIARRCRSLNERNGAVVSARLGHVQRRLRALRGTSAPPVYGPKGMRSGGFGARDFGRV